MGMPSTGCVGILAAPNGACSSISLAACNTQTGPQSLLALAASAGITGTINMTSCWYNYCNDVKISPTLITGIANTGAVCSITVCAPAWNTATLTTNNSGMLSYSTPVTPSPTGVVSNVTISANAGVARQGNVTYTGVVADIIPIVTFCQLAGVVYKCVNLGTCTTSGCGTGYDAYQYAANTVSPALVAGNCYCVCVVYNGSCSITNGSVCLFVCVGGSGGMRTVQENLQKIRKY